MTDLNQPRLGRCYELSYQFVLSNPAWTLVHGFIEDKLFGTGNRIDHAWCVKEGKYYDPVIQKEFNEEVAKVIFNSEPVKQYPFEQAIEMALQHETYGPWHDIDNSEIKHPDYR